jgi:hypothetical protein
MRTLTLCCLILLFLALPRANGLAWYSENNGQPIDNITFIYGEVDIIASAPGMYFCPFEWDAGEPAGGYCGPQEQSVGNNNLLCTIWDESVTPPIQTTCVQYDPGCSFAGRLTGEGQGSTASLPYLWQTGEVFKFALTKVPDSTGQNTLTTYYYYDIYQKAWLLMAQFSSPNTTYSRVAYFHGINAFVENFGSANKAIPKLARFRLWAGSAPDNLALLTKAYGEYPWGVLNGSFYIANGADIQVINALIEKQLVVKGDMMAWQQGQLGSQNALTVPNQKLSADTIAALKALPLTVSTVGVPLKK